MRSQRRRQWQLPGAGTGFSGGSDSDSDSDSSEPAAAFRCSDRGMVTSGSFLVVSSRWTADVKGKPDSESGA